MSMLAQVNAVLGALSSTEQFTQVDTRLGASVGMHVRHVLDHYAALLHATTTATVVQYDERARDTDVENSLAAARLETKRLSEAVGQVAPASLTVEFLRDGGGRRMQLESNIERELAFVGHHAIHHLAMVRLILEHTLQVDIPTEDLGKAPSTIHFEQPQQQQMPPPS